MGPQHLEPDNQDLSEIEIDDEALELAAGGQWTMPVNTTSNGQRTY